jgi:hypothetical protein
VRSALDDSERFTRGLAAAERGSASRSVQSIGRRNVPVRSLGPPSDAYRGAGSRMSDGPAMQHLSENWSRRSAIWWAV